MIKDLIEAIEANSGVDVLIRIRSELEQVRKEVRHLNAKAEEAWETGITESDIK